MGPSVLLQTLNPKQTPILLDEYPEELKANLWEYIGIVLEEL